MDADRLKYLREQVRSATGPDRDLDQDLHWNFDCLNGLWPHQYREKDGKRQVDRSGNGSGDWRSFNEPNTRPYMSSIDVAVALIERCLPGWAHAHIKEEPRGCIGYVHNNANAFVGIGARPNPRRQWFEERASTPPLALWSALLSALIARADAAPSTDAPGRDGG